MRTVVSSREVAHLWAHQAQDEARNSGGTLYFRGDTIYSYGSHFPIARRVRAGLVLFTTDSYSVTTAKHISYVRQAIPLSWEVILVTRPDESPDWLLQGVHNEIEEAMKRMVTPRTRRTTKDRLFGEIAGLVAKGNRLAEIFEITLDGSTGPRKPFAMPESLEAIRAEVEERKRQREEEERIAAERYRERQKADRAQRRIEYAAVMERWRNSSDYIHIPYGLPTMLRIVGNEVETSYGARFPVAHARRGLRLVRSVMASGQEYNHTDHSFHLGSYVIQKIETNGNVTAGCHYVEWSEIERIAPLLETAQENDDDKSIANENQEAVDAL